MNTHAQFMERLDSTTSQLIAATKESVDGWVLLDEILRGGVAPTFLPGTRQYTLFGKRKGMFGQHLPHGSLAQTHGLEITWAGNMCELASTIMYQVLNGQPCALSIVWQYTKRVWICHLGMSIDHWG